jgi:hypothetical protein
LLLILVRSCGSRGLKLYCISESDSLWVKVV